MLGQFIERKRFRGTIQIVNERLKIAERRQRSGRQQTLLASAVDRLPHRDLLRARDLANFLNRFATNTPGRRIQDSFQCRVIIAYLS